MAEQIVTTLASVIIEAIKMNENLFLHKLKDSETCTATFDIYVI